MDAILNPTMNYSKEERDELISSFRKHKGIYTVMSAMVTKYRAHVFLNILIFAFHLYLLVYALYLSLYREEDLTIASECAYFTLIFTCAIPMALTVHLKMDTIRSIVRQVTYGVYHYGDSIDPETAAIIDKITTEMKKRKFWLMNFLEILFNVFFTGCFFVLPVLAGKFSSKPELRERMSNITNYILVDQAVVIGWYPFEANIWPVWLLVISLQYYIGITILFILDGNDLTFVGFAEESCHQIQVLNICLRRILKRSRYVYQKKYGREVKSYEETAFQSCIKECMADSVKHHCESNKFFNEVLSGYTGSIFFVMVTGALLLCMSGLIFISKRVHIGTKIAFLLYLIGEATHVFIFSYYGEKIRQLSSETRDAVYDIEWEVASRTLLPYVIMIQGMTNEPLKVSAGGLVDCSFDSFGNVVSSAYSYLNLLSASTEI